MILTYINPLNKNYKGERTYEFLFSEKREIDFGEDWDVSPASNGTITPPPLNEIIGVAEFVSKDLELELALNSDHFSMYDCVENVIAIGWEKESPNNEDRLVFHFGDTFEKISQKLYDRDKKIKLNKL
jgi:hypothetical protein